MENIGLKETLNTNGVIKLDSLKGYSMWPFIKKGSTALVVKKENRLKLFDVGLFIRKDNTLVLHRVIKVNDNGYEFIGDSQRQTEIVKEDAVLGVLDSFYYKGKQVKVDDLDYIERVKSWYEDKDKRAKKIKRFYRRLRNISRIKKLFFIKDKNNDWFN